MALMFADLFVEFKETFLAAWATPQLSYLLSLLAKRWLHDFQPLNNTNKGYDES